MPAGFDFVISAPDYDARMIAQPFDLLDGLLAHVLLEGNVARNHISAKHEFLPYHDAKFIADIVEVIGLVIAAAPFANHIHVGIARSLEDFPMNLSGDAGGKTVEGNHIRAFRIHGDAIYHELKTLPPL